MLEAVKEVRELKIPKRSNIFCFTTDSRILEKHTHRGSISSVLKTTIAEQNPPSNII